MKNRDYCIACRKIGAVGRGHSYIKILGSEYPLCYRHTQILCHIKSPEESETYECDTKNLGLGGFMPRAGKRMQCHVPMEYEAKDDTFVWKISPHRLKNEEKLRLL